MQVALVNVTADMGPFEVVPGSHLPPPPPAPGTARGADAAFGAGGGGVGSAPPTLAVRVLVGPGDVTIYSTNVQHRGGANTARRSRPTFHIAVIGDGAGPTGIPYTVLADDVRAMHPRRPEVEAPLLGGLAGGGRAVVGSDAW